MVNRKFILRALVVLVVVSAIAATVIWRYERHQQKAAAALAKKSKGKIKAKPAKEPDDDPPDTPKKEKVPKATALSPAAREHLAEKAFISDLRAALIWRSSQPQNPETNRALLEKLTAIAFADLPPERKSAWQSLLQAWKSLEDPAKAADPMIKEQGQRAADTLNAMLRAHGEGDIVL